MVEDAHPEEHVEENVKINNVHVRLDPKDIRDGLGNEAFELNLN